MSKYSSIAASQGGFTLLEVLVALSIAAMIAVFAIGGLKLILWASTVSHVTDGSTENEANVVQLRSLISKTWAATSISSDSGLAALHFNGREQGIDFVTLSEGYAMEGGLIRSKLSLDCKNKKAEDRCSLKLATSIFRSNPAKTLAENEVEVLPHVKQLKIRYLDIDHYTTPPMLKWTSEWRGRSRLPAEIEILVKQEYAGKERVILMTAPLRNAGF
ncbi:PulJ/GspJ family protein [Agrobacterium salinitolerans]|uniref:prepilin-type N-terminal cleavage/methylation domain-containing protein n=1 Tax=Agrobacterium TaxID=357 RepID=UPI001838362F|nr:MULTISPECIES: prepilin-type N-terminal cleavage/methylation domain-containing protein [Agrobacterium]MBA4774775.1 prepilin-type N-terminal cleavage/methylation domain-containing protein [Hyphomicrobiales bacterium]MCZ7888012.1 prepilin-type N-terminal cleavage/methylation domain-containing protein [Agrobacterium salinitolerans]MDA5629367.1 prepilin-type N-terminal cleavage/methylation domain-containing protein [Agrobacterium sp. ST15.16.055]MDA6980845.1 prepilin-type N-terminal cleavage/meth